MEEKRRTAIVLAAGSGSRMKSPVAKQFLKLNGKPLIYYCLRTLEDSGLIDECILVTGEGDISKVQEEIVDRYGFRKVKHVIAGGHERYASVLNARKLLAGQEGIDRSESYVLVHDGARPFLTEDMIERTLEGAKQDRACVAAMPSKDTVKLVDSRGYAVETPDRRLVWSVQTPQVFQRGLFLDAYGRLEEVLSKSGAGAVQVTDDAGVVEEFTPARVKLVEGSYRNLKVTTPEDLLIAQALLDTTFSAEKPGFCPVKEGL